jgi:hypothetical protein
MTLSKVFSAVLFVALTAFTVSAYTVVMRDGRRVEIPDEFTVTNSTLTYRAGSDIQITIQLNTVDIAATERANGQPMGSLLLRASAPKEVPKRTVQTRPLANRSITNRDLEAYRRVREKSELEYEKRRKELGLPSMEERRKEAAEIQERTREQLLNMRAQEEGAEEYWRSRATPLRTELAAIAAQIDFLRRRIDEIPSSNSFGAFSTNSFGAFSTAIPFGTVGRPFRNFPFQSGITPNVFAPSLVNSGFRARVGLTFGNRRSRLNVNPGNRRSHFPNNPGRFHRGRGGRGLSSFFGDSLLAVPFQSFDYDLQRAELINELDELLMHHVGLRARWRDLEDEARTAGAYPGWLRP